MSHQILTSQFAAEPELYKTPLSEGDLKLYVVDELEDYDGWLQALE